MIFEFSTRDRIDRPTPAPGAQRIIYPSYDPTTQARDVVALDATYAASEVTGFYFYPQALHIESWSCLRRTSRLGLLQLSFSRKPEQEYSYGVDHKPSVFSVYVYHFMTVAFIGSIC